MQTGENEQALRKIIDFTRLLSLAILIVHFYLSCYPAFQAWGLTKPLVNHVVLPLSRMVIFKTVLYAKASALLLLLASLIGSKGKKDETIRIKTIVTYCFSGLDNLLYQQSVIALKLPIQYDYNTVYQLNFIGVFFNNVWGKSAFQDD